MKITLKKIIFMILIFIIAGVLFFILKNNINNQEKNLRNLLKQMGSDFYENYYYDALDDDVSIRQTFLKKYETIGIKINLDNLSRYSALNNRDNLEKFVNNKTNQECDKIDTKAIIYPKYPFEKKSYEIDVELSCGFDESK